MNRSSKLGYLTLLVLVGCSGTSGGGVPTSGASGSLTGDPGAAPADADPHVGIYVSTEIDYPNIEFDEITLLPGGIAYNRVPLAPGPLAAFDCERDKRTDDKWAACGTWTDDGGVVTVTFPRDRSPRTCTLSNAALDCGGSGLFLRGTPDGGATLDGTYTMTWSSSSTVYDQTNTFTKDRSLTFSSGSGSFRATGFTGTLASADGTVPQSAGMIAGASRRWPARRPHRSRWLCQTSQSRRHSRHPARKTKRPGGHQR